MARRLLREFLAQVEGGDLCVDSAELVLSELVGNAVQHARTPPGRLIFVRFELAHGLLRIEVHDADGERPRVRTGGWEAECGRGLWLVDRLSVEWGCCPRAGGIGKALWAVLGPELGSGERDDR